MGTSTTRITTADFVTPPELSARRLSASGAGRIGGARLVLARGPAGTQLRSWYHQVPLSILPPFQFGPEQPTLLYLLNPTAGLLEGDAQRLELSAQSGSRAMVVGQSATRIHPCPTGFSTQQWRIHVDDDAVLVVLPGPAIPFQGCRYYQRVEIELAPSAGLVWGDLWFAGRYARGVNSEQFQFDTLIQDLRVERGGQRVFRDRFCWHGPWDRATAAWHFGEHPACGSLFVTGKLPADLAGAAACFLTASDDTCLRWCGPSEQVTADLVQAALGAAAHLAGSAGPWLRGHDLAPAHWFSVGGRE